ncbi:MAG: transglutaminase domain-containing protein [Armatimonadota bacterium]|nr:transglutaminase domain-containing protein [Armatimonadota bacterium]
MASVASLSGRVWGFLERHRFTPVPHRPPAETPAERRRWLALMLAGWLTMYGALLAATALVANVLVIVELAVIITAAFPVVWRLHFSSLPRFWPNWITFIAAVALGIVHLKMGWLSGASGVSRLVLSYRFLVVAFYWVMAFRAFAMRSTRDLTQTALPACSGLLLVLLSVPTTTAIAGTVVVIGGTLGMLAGEHAAERLEEVDARVASDRIRGGRWRPTVNSWLALMLAAAVAAVIMASVAARLEPSNLAGRWLRRQLAWRLARLMIREGPPPHMTERSLQLGGPAPEPRDRLMLIVKAEGPLRMRTGTYDIYEGDRWRQSQRQWRRLRPEAGGRYQFPAVEEMGLSPAVIDELDVEVTSAYGFLGTLPVAWCPRYLEVDVPSMRIDRSGMVMFTGHFMLGEKYRGVIASPAAVMAPPGAEPPKPVDMQYALQLPDGLPDRVRRLARRIVAEDGAEDPTGIALAITNYVKAEYEYDLEAPPLPEGRDYVDHFLFESRTGYCNHFASAAAVLLRTLSVPTRLVTGFTSGEFRPQRQVYEIRDQDAHAWVEVFLSRAGWIDLDPTPEPEEPEEEEGEAGGAAWQIRQVLGSAGAWAVAHRIILLALGIGLVVVVIALGVGGRWYRWRIRPLRPGVSAEGRILHAYRQALRWLEGEGLAREPSDAPWEFARDVTAARPAVAQDLSVLTEKYVGARFAARAPEDTDAGAAEQALRRLREILFSLADAEEASD